MNDSRQLTEYAVGAVYYRVLYFDRDLTYPSIETLVFLGTGKDLRDELRAEEGLLYFQDAESFAKHGRLNSCGHSLDRDDLIVRAMERRDAELTVHDIDGMVERLKR